MIGKQHQHLYSSLAKIENECKLKKSAAAAAIGAKTTTNGTGHAGKPLVNGNGKAVATNGAGKDEEDTITTVTTADELTNKEANGEEGLDATQDVNMKSLNGDEGEEESQEKTGQSQSGEEKTGEAMVVLD